MPARSQEKGDHVAGLGGDALSSPGKLRVLTRAREVGLLERLRVRMAHRANTDCSCLARHGLHLGGYVIAEVIRWLEPWNSFAPTRQWSRRWRNSPCS